MDLVSVECPSCGASLPPAEPTGGYVCEYCGERFELGRARGAKTMAGQQISVKDLAKALAQAQQRLAAEQAAARDQARAQLEAQANSAQAGSRAGARAAVLGVVAAMIGVGVVTSVAVVGQVDGAREAVTGAIEKAGAAVRPMLWDNVGGLPIPVTLGGKPAVIGRTRNVLDGDKLFLDAYDLATRERIWRIEGLGTYGTGYQHVRYGVVGDKVVVTDAAAKLHIHDLATGARIQTLDLTDKAAYVCTPGLARRSAGVLPPAPPEQEHLAWIEQIDKRTFLLDPATGELKKAGRPKWCARSVHAAQALASGQEVNAIERRYAHKVRVPKVEGTRISRAFVVGERAVALGVKNPGTPVPRAIGYVPGAKEPEWVVDVADVQPASVRNTSPLGSLDERHFVAVFGVGQDQWRMTALDPASGERQWGRALRPVFAVDDVDSVTLAGPYVLLVHSSALEIYDATTGEPTGVIGQIQYE